MARSRHTAAVLRIAWVAIYILVAVLLTAGCANAGDVSRSGTGHVGTAHVYDDSGKDAFARRDEPARTDPTSWVVPFENADALDLLTVGAELVQNSSPVAPMGAAEDGAALSGRMRVSSALGDKAVQNAVKFSEKFPEEGMFDVVGHGTPTDVAGMSPGELADSIRSNPGWNGQNVRLISCEAGCPTGGFAQDLANELGVNEKAPTTVVEFSNKGNITFWDGGKWVTYGPG